MWAQSASEGRPCSVWIESINFLLLFYCFSVQCKWIIFRVILHSQQRWGKNTQRSQIPTAHPVCTASAIINILHQSGTLVTIDEPTLTCHYPPKSTVTLRFPLELYILWIMDKCIVTCSHHYGLIQNTCTDLKILCALPVHPSLPPSPQPLILFTGSIILPFSECHIVGIIQYVAFSD